MRCYATETMTCVGRYTGRALKLNGKVFHYAAYRDGLTEDLYVTVGWQDEAETADIAGYVKLGLDSGDLAFTALDGWDTPVCRIPWSTSPDRVFIRAKNSWSGMTNGIISTEAVTVYQSRPASLPAFSMTVPALYADYSHLLRWVLTPGDDRIGWVTGVEYRYRAPGEDSFAAVSLYGNTLLSSCQAKLGVETLGKEVCLAIEYRTFAADWDGTDTEDFVTLNRYVTPVQQVDRNGSVPLSPEIPETTLLLAGGKVMVSWDMADDPLYGDPVYVLERRVTDTAGNGSEYVQLYSGTSVRFRDTLPADAAEVQYRVRAEYPEGGISPWAETGMLEAAQSNVYIGRNGSWLRAAAVQAGSHAASPLFAVGNGR